MQILAGFIREHVMPAVAGVEGIELEFELPGELHPSMLLGEQGGSRGKGQTSPDVAFQVRMQNGSEGLILTESKYCEHWFYQCSAYQHSKSAEREQNPDRSRCFDISGLLACPRSKCHQHTWGRKYWDWLTVNEPLIKKLTCCPAVKGGYQLLRQQALAEGLATRGEYGAVVSCVAYDSRNAALTESLREVGVLDVTVGWGPLFAGKAKFTTFTHQQWVKWVREHELSDSWQEWSNYVQHRYGY